MKFPAIQIAVFCLLLPVSGRGLADDSPTLLVLRVADDETGQERESRLIEELVMVLDDVRVEEVETVAADFETRALDEQIAVVRPLIEKRGALAATWIHSLSKESVALHMAAVSSGRAQTRLVEMAATPGFEGDLAVAVKELLGTEFLFHEIRDEEKAAATAQENQPPTTEPDDDTKEPTPLWRLGIAGGVQGGVHGHLGPSLRAGGTLSIERRFSDGFHGRALLNAGGGYLDGTDAAGIRCFFLGAGFGASYKWQWSALFLGPAVEVEGSWTTLNAEKDGSTQRFSYFNYRVVPLLEVEWRASRRLGLRAGGGLGFTSRRESYFRTSTDENVLITPYVTWEGRLGLVFHL